MQARIVIAVLLGVILGVPFVMTAGARSGHKAAANTPRLIIVSPHVPQIRTEFGRAFADWHEAKFGEPVEVDWRAPGGTSEIRKQLDAIFQAAVKNLASKDGISADTPDTFMMPQGSVEYDIFFGGGSYDHGGAARPMNIAVTSSNGEVFTAKIRQTAPAGFTQAELDELFGPNFIGPQQLYDPQQRWIGTALSSFGIVYNRDVLERLGVEVPTSFRALGNPKLISWVALADPRQSGSITTTFDSILGNEGWEDGWRTLRSMSGATRYFTNSSTKPPIDVSQGEAAAALAIDFYGRGQAQVIAESGGGDRVGYTDPAGSVYVDADPISLINGGPNPELAKRFIRFTLTDQAQALWQFRASDESNPTGPNGKPMGPTEHELRRMPVRRAMYDQYFDAFIDRVDPYDIVSDVENPGWRTGVQVMMGCFGVDLANECRAAYVALNEAEASGDFTPSEITKLERMFYAFPETDIQALANLPGFTDLSEADRTTIANNDWKWITDVPADASDSILSIVNTSHSLPFTESNYRAVRNEWRQSGRKARLKIEYTRFFREQYRAIVREVNAR
ncbi:MAG: ABC transporter substrate-binding protein [Phycisphaerales bacterium]